MKFKVLKKFFRIRKKTDFSKVQKLGKSIPGKFFFIKFIDNKKKEPRIGIIVSLKVSKKATERNLIKRRTREIAKINLPKIKSGYDIVIFASQKAKKASFEELKEDFYELLIKSGIIK